MRVAANDYAKKVADLKKRNTVKATSKHDYYGYLAHQAVENKLEQNNLEFESKQEVGGPDAYDILFTGDKIDVKATHRDHYDIDTWWEYQNFLVFKHQVDREVLQQKDSIIFCVVDDPSSLVYIFGNISVDDFLSKSHIVGPHNTKHLKWDNYQISAKKLTPLWEFLLRA